MDVLAPPENYWLKELVRHKNNLPAGVNIVRFSDADEELAEDSEGVGSNSRPSKKIAA
jgi:hypothetical protein